MTAEARVGVEVPARTEALSSGWLTAVLGSPVDSAAAVPIGHGMMADTFRVALTGDGVPSSVVVKVAAADDASRRAARTYRSYELEVGFYRELAPKVTARVPHCHWAGWDAGTGDYVVVLEDLGAGRGGDQLTGCDAGQAAATVRELARLHGDFWNGARQYPWLQRYGADDPATFAEFVRRVLPAFLDGFGSRLSGDVVGVFERFADLAHRYDRKGQIGPQTVTHGDLRADNLIFDRGGSGDGRGATRAAILDWQNLFRGNGLIDVGYFLGTSLTVEDRREHERDLVRSYHSGLVTLGIDADPDGCWDGYRRHSFAGMCVVLRSFDAVRTDPERERRFLAMAERSAQQVLDLSAESILHN